MLYLNLARCEFKLFAIEQENTVYLIDLLLQTRREQQAANRVIIPRFLLHFIKLSNRITETGANSL